MKKPNLNTIIADNLNKAKFQSKTQPSLPSDGWLNQYQSGGTYLSDRAKATQFGQYKNGGGMRLDIPVIDDAGNFNQDGIWVPDWETMTAQAKKLGSKKVKTRSGNLINFNSNWEVIDVDDNPGMMKMGGGMFPPYHSFTAPRMQNGGPKPKYEQWIKTVNPDYISNDYNLRDAYNELPYKLTKAWAKDPERNHLPDTYKLPNHPTFSNESKYYDGFTPGVGGYWGEGEENYIKNPPVGPPMPYAKFMNQYKKGGEPTPKQLAAIDIAKNKTKETIGNLPIYSPDARYQEYQDNIPYWKDNISSNSVEVDPSINSLGSYFGKGAPSPIANAWRAGKTYIDPSKFNRYDNEGNVLEHEIYHAGYNGRDVPEFMSGLLNQTNRNPNSGEHANMLNEQLANQAIARRDVLDEFNLPLNTTISEKLSNEFLRRGINARMRNPNAPEYKSSTREAITGNKPGTFNQVINYGSLPTKKNGGGLLSRTVTCSNCGWSWKAVDGGKDVMTCHKCGGMIKMKNGGLFDQYNKGGLKCPEGFINIDGKCIETDSQEYIDMLDNGRVGTMKDGIFYGNKANLQNVTVFASKDKKTQEFYDRLRTADDSEDYDPNYYGSLIKLGQKYGFPKVSLKDKANTLDLADINLYDHDKKYRASYNPGSNRMSLDKNDTNGELIDHYLAELSHHVQRNKHSILNLGLREGKALARSLKNSIVNFESPVDAYGREYDTKGSIENEAHNEIEPKLIKDFYKNYNNRLWANDYYQSPGTFSYIADKVKTYKNGGSYNQYDDGGTPCPKGQVNIDGKCVDINSDEYKNIYNELYKDLEPVTLYSKYTPEQSKLRKQVLDEVGSLEDFRKKSESATPSWYKGSTLYNPEKDKITQQEQYNALWKQSMDRFKGINERNAASNTRENGVPFTLPTGETLDYNDMNFRQKRYVDGKNLENVFRVFPNEESAFDNFLNPLNFIGGLAGALAKSPYEAQQSNSNMPYISAVANPLLMGRVMGSGSINPLGSKFWTNQVSNGEFANSLLMGVPGLTGKAGKFVGVDKGLSNAGRYLTEETALKNAYKYNPWAFKPKSNTFYRGLGRTGLDDALESGVLRTANKTGKYGEDLYMTDQFGDAVGNYSRDQGYGVGDPFDGPWESFPAKDPKSYVAEIPQTALTNRVNVPGNANIVINKGSLPIDNINFLKENWLQGYKKVPKPTFISSSAETKNLSGILGKLFDIFRKKEIPVSFDDELKILNGNTFGVKLPKNYITELDVVKNYNREKSWLQSEEYIKRRSTATGETVDEIKKDVDKILNKFKNIKISAEKFDKKSLRGQYSSTGTIKLNNQSTRQDALSTLDHEIKHATSQVATTNNYKNYPTAEIGNDISNFLNSNFNLYLRDEAEQQVRSLRLLDFIENKYGIPRGQKLTAENIKTLMGDIRVNGIYNEEFHKNYDDVIDQIVGMQEADQKLKFIPSNLLKMKLPIKYKSQGNFNQNLLDHLNKAYAVPAIGLGAGATLLNQKKEGGMITDPMGQWAHPGENTRIPGGNITMQGVPYPVLAKASNGQQQMMYPGQEYSFPGASHVDEYPMMKEGGQWLEKYQSIGEVKKRPTLYTEDPRKVKAYQDSLNLYNKTRDIENLKHYKGRDNEVYPSWYTWKGSRDQAEKFAKKNNIDFNYDFYRKGKFPGKIQPVTTGDWGEGMAYPIYKKPVQPYLLGQKPIQQTTVQQSVPVQQPVVTQQVTPVQTQVTPGPTSIDYTELGSPIYAQIPMMGGTASGAFVGYRTKDGQAVYVKPEDYQRMGVDRNGREYIEAQTKKQKYGGSTNWLDKYQVAGQVAKGLQATGPIDIIDMLKAYKWATHEPTLEDAAQNLVDPTGASNIPFLTQSVREMVKDPSILNGVGLTLDIGAMIPGIGEVPKIIKRAAGLDKISKISKLAKAGEKLNKYVGKPIVTPIVKAGVKTVEAPATVVKKAYKAAGFNPSSFNNPINMWNKGVNGWKVILDGAEKRINKAGEVIMAPLSTNITYDNMYSNGGENKNWLNKYK